MSSFTEQDHRAMQRALHLAEKGRYTTHPNPRVGCVIMQDTQIVGEGAHFYAGEAHAEVHALNMAGKQAQGATAYVTLEPCSHTGKTPPCASALIAAGVAKVIVAMQDPNPLVSGSGLQHLQDVGIKTASGLLESQARQLNQGFIKRMETQRPFVRVKLAMSLDGCTAMESGESMWITGAAARQDVQRLRAQADAILTGTGTLISDDPSLNVRLSAEELGLTGAVRQPNRVILDAQLLIPPSAKLLHLAGNNWIFTHSQDSQKIQPLQQLGAEVITLDPPLSSDNKDPDALSLEAVLLELGRRQINEVHVEAGATLCGALLEAGLVDEIVVYMAAHIMGNNTRALFNLPNNTRMQERIALNIQDIRAIGDDWRITAIPTTTIDTQQK